LAMPMYAFGVVPLIQQLADFEVSQMWYADDASMGGSLESLHSCWDSLICLGPDLAIFQILLRLVMTPSPPWLAGKEKKLIQ